MDRASPVEHPRPNVRSLARLIVIAIALFHLGAPVVASSSPAPVDDILMILSTDVQEGERQERLVQALRRLDQQGRLTPTSYLAILVHPSGQQNYPDLNRALAQAGTETAIEIFNTLLTDPLDLPYRTLADVQRSMANQLSELTDRNGDDRLLAKLRREGNLAVQLPIARSFSVSRRREIEDLAIGWSRDLDLGAYDTAERRQDPLWGQQKLQLRRELNRLLADIGTARCLGELQASLQGHVDSSPTWLVKDGIDLLGTGGHRPAYPLARKIALDGEQELVTRTAALKALAALHAPDQRDDVARVARQLLDATRGESVHSEVRAVIESLDGG